MTDDEDEATTMAQFAYDLGKVMGALSGGQVKRVLIRNGTSAAEVSAALEALKPIVQTFYRR